MLFWGFVCMGWFLVSLWELLFWILILFFVLLFILMESLVEEVGYKNFFVLDIDD